MKLYLLTGIWTSLLLLPSFGQTGTGTIHFSVKDQFDGAVAGAEISITPVGNDSKVPTLNARTDKRGAVIFAKVKSGEYKIMASARGFKNYSEGRFILRTEEAKIFEIVLEVAPIESNVDIEGNDSVDAANTGGSTDLDERMIDNLPDDPEELERMLKTLGQAVTGRTRSSKSV